MIILQLILWALILPLTVGPLGHFLFLHYGGPDLIVVVAWAFTWFTNRTNGVIWALLCGLTLDLTTFLLPGTWTVSFLIVVLLTDLLRGRIFDVSSPLLAVATIAVVSLISQGIISLAAHSFDIEFFAVGIIANVLLATLIYYLLGYRFRFFQKWKGGQL